MGRRTQERRKVAEQRWPLLSNLMACHFNEDFTFEHGSLSGAIAAAVRSGSVEHRRAILREWRDWQLSEGMADDIRQSLNDSFSIAVFFKQPIDARNLMNRIYDGLIEGVRAETRHNT
jgi:hypothetical protein